MHKSCGRSLIVLLSAVTIFQAIGVAATLPTGFTESQVAGGLTNATAMAFAPDGRLFVCLQGGQLRVIENGVLLSTPFLTVTVNSSGERGLLGVAFDPNFNTNHFVYVYYTATTPAVHNRVSRFTANGNVAVAGSETAILDLNNLSSATNHNGGALHFGDDGKLYIAVGENATSTNAQTLNNLLGKMLRINADGSIPTDNPFFAQASGQNRAIWALGLRNPFTFAFQPFTGRMFINDVGQNTYEEIDDGIAGSNYGWPNSEGPTTNPYRSPIYYYDHTGGACAITGGTFYDPTVSQFPSAYVGTYFFADYCAGWIRRLDPANGNAVTDFASGISLPVDLQVGPDGSLYYLARGASSIWKIQYTGAQAPVITQHPSSQTVTVGRSAMFSVAASGTPPLSYQWQRDQSNIAGATASTYTISSASMADNGARFRCIVTNTAGNAVSNEATLTVINDTAPVASITQPAQGAIYSAGDTIAYAGTGTDAEDGDLPPGAFTWQVDFHHDTHFHPFIPATTGATGGSFVVPRTGETAANVWYRIHLTVVDSQGVSAATYRDVLPRTVAITLATQPSGLQLTLDGQPLTAPLTFSGVVGIYRTIGAPSPQGGSKGGGLTFSGWSDGGAATHQITTPASTTTYTASFGSGGATVPPAPANLVATPGNGTVGLSWSASTGATSYNVLRSTTNGGPYGTITTGVTTTSYTDTAVTNGTTYYYVVQAVNSAGPSANSNQASATPAAVTGPPAAPTGLTATAGAPGSRTITLTWTASSGATSYKVKRSNVSGSGYTTIASGVTATTYVDTNFKSFVPYYYVVSAVNSAGESANSTEASATPR